MIAPASSPSPWKVLTLEVYAPKMTKSPNKRGRPPAVVPKPKKLERTVAYLDEERLRQLEELVAFSGSNTSKAIAQAISFHHASMKKEWPNNFS